jgi:NodT family efflux transporter outer membrane factor (OMF) lipoprotein
MREFRRAILAAGCAALSACTVGPDYEKPAAPVASAYKEGQGWKIGQPSDALDRGPWWQVYGDPTLSTLESQIDISNQTLKASEAAFRQSVALVAESRAGLFPSLTGNAGVTRSGGGGGSKSFSSSSSGRGDATEYSASLGLSWDLDVWGRIRRTVESDVATAQASAGDLASARLSAQATLATDYFQLCALDDRRHLLDQAVEAYKQSLRITENQYRNGVAAKADVVIARTQVETTQAQVINVGVQRALYEHAIAVLIGKPAGDFAIAECHLPDVVPVAPTGLPSTLLERRPDIAAAERRMAAANAQIGVAEAAYYPDLTLSASVGFVSTALSSLFNTASRTWSVGPSLAETLFDGGLRSAQARAAGAFYDESVANYRQTVLTGFQQVEDQLATLRILESQAEVEVRAVASAREAELLELNQYKAGTVAYTSVVTAQQTALSNEEAALNVQQSRLVASVTLIQSLGGGWDQGQLPARGPIVDGEVANPASGAK